MTLGAAETAKRVPPTTLVTTVLVFVNLVAVYIELLLVLAHYEDHETTNYLLPQDIWLPFMTLVLGQSLVNGLLLLTSPRVRRIGAGLLLGTMGAVAAWLCCVAVFGPGS